MIYCKRGKKEKVGAGRCRMVCIFRISDRKLRGLIANYFYYLREVGDKSSLENGCGSLRKLKRYKIEKLLLEKNNKINGHC